jgi:hypothetical protein
MFRAILGEVVKPMAILFSWWVVYREAELTEIASWH